MDIRNSSDQGAANNIKDPDLVGLIKIFEKAQKDNPNSIKQVYAHLAKTLCDCLNVCGNDDERRGQILATLAELDRQYLVSQGYQITGHVLLSRHGECNNFSQKRFGLNPNAPISEEADQLEATKKQTHFLQLYQNEPMNIAISPMVRPLQTAKNYIPKDTSGADIGILPELVEDSDWPSGMDLRSLTDFQDKGTGKGLISRFLFWLSEKISAVSTFVALTEKRKEAARAIAAYGRTDTNLLTENDDIPKATYDPNSNKVKTITNTIFNIRNCDGWLFGHGKNFKALFKKLFNVKSGLDFGETRRIYNVKKGEEETLFCPSYTLVVNQKTGFIEGKALKVENNFTSKEVLGEIKGIPSNESSQRDPVGEEKLDLGNKRLPAYEVVEEVRQDNVSAVSETLSLIKAANQAAAKLTAKQQARSALREYINLRFQKQKIEEFQS